MKKIYYVYDTVLVTENKEQKLIAVRAGGEEIPIDIFGGREDEANADNTTKSKAGKWKFSKTKADKKIADKKVRVKLFNEGKIVDLSIQRDKAISLGFDGLATDLEKQIDDLSL